MQGTHNAPLPRERTSRNPRKLGLPWLILIALVSATLLSAYQSWRESLHDADIRFAEIVRIKENQINNALQDVEAVLQGAAGLVASTPAMTEEQWNTYFDAIEENIAHFPGLTMAGYGIIPPEHAAKSVKPVHFRRTFSPGSEIIPASQTWHSNDALADAIARATATRKAALSDPLDWVPRIPSHATAVALAIPVYSNLKAILANTNTVEPAPTGFVYAVIRIDKLIAYLRTGPHSDATLVLSDGNKILFSSHRPPYAPARPSSGRHQAKISIPVGERHWSMQVVANPSLEQDLVGTRPILILTIGSLGTIFLAVLVWLLSRLRHQAELLAQNMTIQLRDQVKFTEDLIEFNPLPIFRKDYEGRFIAVNRAWEKFAAITRDQILGKRSRDFQPPDIAEANESHDALLYKTSEGFLAQELSITNNEGITFETIISKAVLHKSDGSIDGLIGNITDVTPIKQLEHELHLQREQLDLVIRASQQGIWDLDLREGGKAYYSDRFKEILGYQPEDNFPLPFEYRNFGHPDDVERFTSAVIQHIKGNTPLFDIESRARARTGHYIWIRARGVALRNAEGRAIRFTGSIIDITPNKNAEKELMDANRRVVEAAQAKEAFLATMSHEIRTPLNGVLGMASLLSDTRLTTEQREYIRIIRASGDTLLRLIDDVLDFSKIESGRMMFENAPVEIIAMVEEALELVVEKAREKGLALLYEIADEVPNYILGDITRLRQILLNLLSNAIKFTATGEVRVKIGIRNVMAPKFELEISVSDTGVGIPQDSVSKLFQPFTQVDASTTRRYGGTGLGLAICKRLAVLMGGDIEVKSIEGRGSVFTSHIVTEAARGRLKPYMQRNVADFEGKRVLFIDNYAPRLQVLSNIMQHWGLEVIGADYENASHILTEQGPFDVLITNILQPAKEGLALAAALETIDAGRAVPTSVILFSRLQRAELAKIHLLPAIRHDFLIVRTLPRAKLFDILMRAVSRRPHTDVATRPFTPEPVYDPDFLAMRKSTLRDKETMAPIDANTPEANSLPATPQPSLATGKFNILVAEDNEINQRVVTGMLKNLGHQAAIANNGREAVQMAMENYFHAILMDIHMPELDGLSAMHQIRQQMQGKRCPPIIAMTAHAMAGDREHYLSAGMDDYIPKPIKITQLESLLNRIASLQGLNPSPVLSSVPAATPGPIADGIGDLQHIPVLDKEQIEELRQLPATSGGDVAAGDPMGGLIQLFQKKAQERLQFMRGQLADANWTQLSETAHSLRGASASIGLGRVAELCKKIELAARELAGQSVSFDAKMDMLFSALEFHFVEANKAIDAWVDQPSTQGTMGKT